MRHTRRVMKAGFLLLVLFVGSACLPQQANAHRPIFTEDKATGPDTAIPIKDPQISQVVYREITKDSSQVWLAFEVPKDFKLFVQIGVPAIDRLKDFRPAMAIVGPGLPDNDPPLTLPKDAGAKVLLTKEVTKPGSSTNTSPILIPGSCVARRSFCPRRAATTWSATLPTNRQGSSGCP